MFRPQEGDPTFAFLPISFKMVLEKGGFSKVRNGPNAKPKKYTLAPLETRKNERAISQ